MLHSLPNLFGCHFTKEHIFHLLTVSLLLKVRHMMNFPVLSYYQPKVLRKCNDFKMNQSNLRLTLEQCVVTIFLSFVSCLNIPSLVLHTSRSFKIVELVLFDFTSMFITSDYVKHKPFNKNIKTYWINISPNTPRLIIFIYCQRVVWLFFLTCCVFLLASFFSPIFRRSCLY